MTKEFATTLRRVSKMIFLVLFGLFFVLSEVFAFTSIKFENSEGYNLGAINGQQGWTGIGTTDIVDTPIYEGSQSLKIRCCGGTNWAEKTFYDLDNGSLKFYFYPQDSIESQPFFAFKNSVGTILFYAYPNAPSPIGQWSSAIIEWRLENEVREWRYFLNDVETTSWTTFTTSGTINTIRFMIGGGIGFIDYFDKVLYGEIGEGCGEIGYCNFCDFYGCLANSDKCCWIIDECIEGVCYIGGGTCGSGSNLFFCETQESCEGYGGYWWEGTCSSYTQPYLPPQDTCEGLGTIEKWLCEIKNLLKGVFVPSQEKTEELRQTVDEIKQKFPMNYLSGASNFFDSVKTNVNSSSGIDFKILGKAGTVDFAFWEKETEIGGEVQKIGEIVKVFITFLIVLGFVFWAISFGKRVF